MKLLLRKNNKVYEAKTGTGAYYHPQYPDEPLYTFKHLPFIHDVEEGWVKLCGKNEYEVIND